MTLNTPDTPCITGASSTPQTTDTAHERSPILANHIERDSELHRVLAQQQAAFRATPMPTYTEHCTHLRALRQALKQHRYALCEALAQDYGQRSTQDTLLADIMPCLANIRYTLRHLKRWMKPSRRHAGVTLSPANLQVHYQPLGVVGIIVPWNFPVMLSLSPLISTLAAGNRAMIKLSEFTPATNQVLRRLLADAFSADHVSIIEGEAHIAALFSSLPFDHLIFTGSTTIGHQVMRSASTHLTPVTLELGGKSPVIIAPDIPMSLAVSRMLFGKCLNAGQICVAPDYVLVPHGKIGDFVATFIAQFNQHYPGGVANSDFASVINDRQYQRLCQWLDDAQRAGTTVHPCHADARDEANHRLIPHLLTDVPPDATVLQEEIFGPLLPIIGYDNLEEAIAYVTARPRPLALYLMSEDPAIHAHVIHATHSGGMGINETVLHAAADDAPFGGIGPSGIGHYHGQEGFHTLSHAKTVLKRGKITNITLLMPPYGRWWQKLILTLLMR